MNAFLLGPCLTLASLGGFGDDGFEDDDPARKYARAVECITDRVYEDGSVALSTLDRLARRKSRAVRALAAPAED